MSVLRGLQRAVNNLLARAVVTGLNTATKCQSLQVELMPGEPKENVEHLEPYGFTSAPLSGAEGFAMFPDGDRSHGVILMVSDRRYRIKDLKGGEVCLYTDEGDTLTFKRGNIVELKTKTFNVLAEDAVNIDTKKFTLNASDLTAITTAKYTLNASSTATITAPHIALNGNLTVSDASGGGAGNSVIRGQVRIEGNQTTTGTSTATDHVSSGKSGATHRHKGDSGGTTGTPL
ncbi:TPA: phage baseplate assembly protein [Citrobacter farmeri]|nr:phage baseplate assembly protein [Citrobacter farmeri]